jgi:hypothetical protein
MDFSLEMGASMDRRKLVVGTPLLASALKLAGGSAFAQTTKPVDPSVTDPGIANPAPLTLPLGPGPVVSDPASPLTQPEIEAITKLLQNPSVLASCSDNCTCNSACGCKKDSCCEYKCACDGKSSAIGADASLLVENPKYLEVLKSFDPQKLRTINDFKVLSDEINSRVQLSVPQQ